MATIQPNRTFSNPVNTPASAAEAPRRVVVTHLTAAQYESLEKQFPIDPRGEPSFQLGVQAVLKKLRDGMVSG